MVTHSLGMVVERDANGDWMTERDGLIGSGPTFEEAYWDLIRQLRCRLSMSAKSNS